MASTAGRPTGPDARVGDGPSERVQPGRGNGPSEAVGAVDVGVERLRADAEAAGQRAQADIGRTDALVDHGDCLVDDVGPAESGSCGHDLSLPLAFSVE